MPLTSEQIEALLKPKTRGPAMQKPPQVRAYPAPPQRGPVRFQEQSQRCMSRRCGAPTSMKLNGIWYCGPHIVIELNKIIDDNNLVPAVHPFVLAMLEHTDEWHDKCVGGYLSKDDMWEKAHDALNRESAAEAAAYLLLTYCWPTLTELVAEREAKNGLI